VGTTRIYACGRPRPLLLGIPSPVASLADEAGSLHLFRWMVVHLNNSIEIVNSKPKIKS